MPVSAICSTVCRWKLNWPNHLTTGVTCKISQHALGLIIKESRREQRSHVKREGQPENRQNNSYSSQKTISNELHLSHPLKYYLQLSYNAVVRVWRKMPLILKNIITTVMYRSGSIMIQGCFCANGTEILQVIKGNMTGDVCVRSLF